MSIENIISLELEGLSKTIKEYSTDNYIISYANQLISVDYPKETVKFSLLVNKLLDWYSEEIEKIRNSEYTLSKDAHYKSFSLLKELKILLENEELVRGGK